MVRTLPTINYLLDNGAAIILACHIGRPSEAREPQFSTKHLVKHLSELLKKEVKWASDCVGPEAEKAAADLKAGEVLLLENLRYHKGEKKNDPEFAKQLASLADLAVDDAFGVAHRAHASNAGIAQHIPTVAGFLMEREINFIGKTLEAPKRPFVGIIGGSKVSSKIGVVSNMIDKVDKLVIGGGMANTFLLALGKSVGDSLVERDKVDLAKEQMAKAKAKGVEIVLPSDVVVTQEFAKDAPYKTVSVDNIEDGWQTMDSGAESVKRYQQAVKGAKTIVWNGPVGVFEFDNFAKGTEGVAKAVAQATDEGAVSIVGGGDSIAALKKTGLDGKISHISTGGGATLEFLEGKDLPGIVAIEDK